MAGVVRLVLSGRRFGRLVVSRYLGWQKWACVCDCGTARAVHSRSLRLGHTRSCGCLHREQLSEYATVHGYARRGKKTREYRAWINMVFRCTNPKATYYKNYGGRGIRVCRRWRKFENFLADMGPSRPHFSIERKDTDGNYEPGNCRWATRVEQARNSRGNRRVSYQGKTLCLVDWAAKVGISERVISGRLCNGWPVARALSEPLHYRGQRNWHA